jgi:hypothetical protein
VKGQEKKQDKKKEPNKQGKKDMLWLNTWPTAEDCDERPSVKRSFTFVLVALHL